MEKEILEKIQIFKLKHVAKDFGQHMILSLLLDDIELVLKKSPWMRFEGTFDSSPVLVWWYNNEITRIDEIEDDKELYDHKVKYYMPLPPLPIHDI